MITIKTLFDFVKKNWKYTVLVIAVLVISIRGCVRDKIITSQAAKIAELGVINFGLENDRQTLEIQLKILKNNYEKISASNDSMKLVLKAKQKELKDLQIQHTAEIADLLNVPIDSVFSKLQYIYPNYDGNSLRFPFSESQIRPIYSTALQLPRLQSEYSLQGKTLKSCLDLNDGFEKGTLNLNAQIINLTENIGKADKQIEGYKANEVILKRQVNNNRFWKRALLVTSGVLTGIVILK